MSKMTKEKALATVKSPGFQKLCSENKTDEIERQLSDVIDGLLGASQLSE